VLLEACLGAGPQDLRAGRTRTGDPRGGCAVRRGERDQGRRHRGPTAQWIAQAKGDADLIYSGSETMMTDFIEAMGGELLPETVTPLYLRVSAILVRPGNPRHITKFDDLLSPGLKILVVNGAGQKGLWEDIGSKEEQTGFSCRRPGRGPGRGAGGGQDEGARRGSAWVLTAAEGRAVPGRSSGRGESRTSDGTYQSTSWGGEVAGARGRGLEGSRRCSRMAWAVVERRTTATTRRVPPQRGQVRTSVWNVRLRSSAAVRCGGASRPGSSVGRAGD
jgi:Bacterial extracellular solute-binding protein